MAEAVGNSLWRWLPALQVVRAYSWAEARQVLHQGPVPPVFIVSDLQLPGSTAEHTLQSLRQWQPDVPVLALTMLEGQQVQQLCARYGAHYLCKTAAPELLRKALQDSLDPQDWARWSVATEPTVHPLQGLTVRQKDILRELANGRSNREIADLMHISEDTVRSHIKGLFVRLDVKNRTQASKLYLQHKDAL